MEIFTMRPIGYRLPYAIKEMTTKKKTYCSSLSSSTFRIQKGYERIRVQKMSILICIGFLFVFRRGQLLSVP